MHSEKATDTDTNASTNQIPQAASHVAKKSEIKVVKPRKTQSGRQAMGMAMAMATMENGAPDWQKCPAEEMLLSLTMLLVRDCSCNCNCTEEIAQRHHYCGLKC